MAESMDKYTEAEAFYAQARRLDPADPAPLRYLGELYRHQTGDWDKARQMFETILQMPADQIPNIKEVLKSGWHFPIPFVVLIYALFWGGEEADTAGLWAILAGALPSPARPIVTAIVELTNSSPRDTYGAAFIYLGGFASYAWPAWVIGAIFLLPSRRPRAAALPPGAR